MQIQLFTIPIEDNSRALEELNRFLRGQRVLDIKTQLVNNDSGTYWCFCIRYLEGVASASSSRKQRIDYKHVLDEATFGKFSRLREIRKQVAAEEGLPAYAIFTDEELAALARLEVINRKSMLSVKGIGEKK